LAKGFVQLAVTKLSPTAGILHPKVDASEPSRCDLKVNLPPKTDASAAAFGGSFPSSQGHPSHGFRQPPCLAWAVSPIYLAACLPRYVSQSKTRIPGNRTRGPKTVSLPSRNSGPQDNNGTPSVPPRILKRPLFFFYLPLSSLPEQNGADERRSNHPAFVVRLETREGRAPFRRTETRSRSSLQ